MDKLGLPGLPLWSGKFFWVKRSESLKGFEEEAELSVLPHMDGLWGRELCKNGQCRNYRFQTGSLTSWIVMLDGTDAGQRASIWVPAWPFIFWGTIQEQTVRQNPPEMLRHKPEPWAKFKQLHHHSQVWHHEKSTLWLTFRWLARSLHGQVSAHVHHPTCINILLIYPQTRI